MSRTKKGIADVCKGEEMRKEVEDMIKKPGVYLAGDVNFPAVTIVLISLDGKIWSTNLDAELDPERFLETLTLKGPYRA